MRHVDDLRARCADSAEIAARCAHADVVLQVEQLTAGHRGTAVAHLSRLQIGAGESVLLLGPSGAGKTTLLLAIAGLAQVLSGRALVRGHALHGEVSSATRDRLRGEHIGFVFQDVHLVGGLSVLDNVLLAPFALGVAQDRARALELLETMGLAAFARHRAQTLSRGQAQRVAIARAMLLRPSIILADEPTASLDDLACDAVISLLERAVRESGSALLIATHDGRLRARFDKQVCVEAIV